MLFQVWDAISYFFQSDIVKFVVNGGLYVAHCRIFFQSLIYLGHFMIFVKYNNIHESTEGVVDHGNGESDSTQPPVLAD